MPVSMGLPGGIPGQEQTGEGFELRPSEAVAAATMPIPLLGDVTGLLADIDMYLNDKASRRWENYGLSALGMFPFFPSAATLKMSKKAAIEGGFYHPVAGASYDPARKTTGIKLSKPIHEMSREVEDIPGLLDPKIITPEDLYGMDLYGLPGDRTDAGKLLKAVGERQLSEPFMLPGGHGFMRTNPEAVWANAKPQVSAINNRVWDTLDQGREAAGIYMPMSHKSNDFSHVMSDVVLRQLDIDAIPKTVAKEFDRAVRKKKPKWVGIKSDKLMEQLEDGEIRKAFVRAMAKPEFQKKPYFPDIPETRFAVSDPGLLDTPLTHGGQSISNLSGEALMELEQPHPAFPVGIGGSYLGGFNKPIPRQVLFPDFHAARRQAGTDPAADYRSFTLGVPKQEANQQWLDGVMDYLNKQGIE